MFTNYKYEKPAFISKTRTDALTAAFAGGGWLHLNDHRNFDPARAEDHSLQTVPIEVPR